MSAEGLARAMTLEGLQRIIQYHQRTIEELDILDDEYGYAGREARERSRRTAQAALDEAIQALGLREERA